MAAALPLRRHEHAQRDAQRPEVVEPHHPLEVVEAVAGMLDGAADRVAAVVDQHRDRPQLLQRLARQGVGLIMVGEVALVELQVPAAVLVLLLIACSLTWSRSIMSASAPASAILSAVALPMPSAGPVIMTTLPRTVPARLQSMSRSRSR